MERGRATRLGRARRSREAREIWRACAPAAAVPEREVRDGERRTVEKELRAWGPEDMELRDGGAPFVKEGSREL